MSLIIASLNSGSNGNCYYVGNKEEAVLIDAGISCRETERRMKRLELSMKKVKAIFITHEHADHISGLHKLVKKFSTPIYVTQKTRKNQMLEWSESVAVHFAAYEPIRIGSLTITASPRFHDANDPHSFVVSSGGVNVGVFTDIGRVSEDVITSFQLCHAAFLESNYDEDMLQNGGYPLHLKNRIRGGEGHLSNKEALQLFLNYRPHFMSHLILSHLSKNNNRVEIVEELFNSVAGSTQIIVASRKEESAIYQIGNTPSVQYNPLKQVRKKNQDQLSLFEV
jgi:phosphoribosyl 1,2-cyclic phosphodiesterase